MLTSYLLIEHEAVAKRHELLRAAETERLLRQARPERPSFQRWLVGLAETLLTGPNALGPASARPRHVPSRKRPATLTRTHRRAGARREIKR